VAIEAGRLRGTEEAPRTAPAPALAR